MERGLEPVSPKVAIGLEKQLKVRYITFDINNLSKVCTELKSKGIEFCCPRPRFPLDPCLG